MAGKQHHYRVELKWTGDRGAGTASYTAYERAHELRTGSKPAIPGSSDPSFRGDAARWNPEELLVASLSACHQLWYLHLCAVNKIVVKAYEDAAEGVMDESADGSGQFASVTLRPRVSITAGSDPAKAQSLHHEAAKLCFIARSMNFPVGHEPTIEVV